MRSYRHIYCVDRADGNLATPTTSLTTQETNVPQEIREMETYSVFLNKDGERRRQCSETISRLLWLHRGEGLGGREKEKVMIGRLFNAAYEEKVGIEERRSERKIERLHLLKICFFKGILQSFMCAN